MSKSITPEWLRVKREVEALWRSAWHAIHELDDRIHHVEKRVEKLESPPSFIDAPPDWRNGDDDFND
jgi:hypothetical protein